MLLLGSLRPSSWCWSVQCWGNEKMAGQGGAGWSSLSFSVIHIFSHFVFNVSLYFPVFVCVCDEDDVATYYFTSSNDGKWPCMEDFIFIHFPRGVVPSISGQSMGTISSMYVVVQGVMGDGGHQHWWFSEWSHCVIVTVNRTEGQEWGLRAPILFLDAVGYFWDHDHSRILYK